MHNIKWLGELSKCSSLNAYEYKLKITSFLESHLIRINPFAEYSCFNKKIQESIINYYGSDAFASFNSLQNDNFLKFKALEIISPFTGRQIRLSSECSFGRFRLSFFEEDGYPCVIVWIGQKPIFCFDFLRKIAIDLFNSKENIFAIIRDIIYYILINKIDYSTIFDFNDESKRLFVIADERPTHFFRQTLGYIDVNINKIIPFIENGGGFLIIKDRCFIDPVKIFSEIKNSDFAYVSDKTASLNISKDVKYSRKFYRTSDESLCWLNRILAKKSNDRIDNSIIFHLCLDVEKNRFLNQIDVFRGVFDFLNIFASLKNKDIKIFVDGWSIKDFGVSGRDKEIFEKIDHCFNEINKGFNFDYEEIYSLDFVKKINKISMSNFSICTHGTAALIPSKILKKPTITYHVKEVMLGEMEFDSQSSYRVDECYIKEFGDQGLPIDRRNFSVDPQGVIEKLEIILKKES